MHDYGVIDQEHQQNGLFRMLHYVTCCAYLPCADLGERLKKNQIDNRYRPHSQGIDKCRGSKGGNYTTVHLWGVPGFSGKDAKHNPQVMRLNDRGGLGSQSVPKTGA